MGKLFTDKTPRQRGRPWARRRSTWLRLHPLCEKCLQEGTLRQGDEVDHVVPLCRGGADDESNFQTLCSPHHKAKTMEDLGCHVPNEIGEDGLPVDPQHPWSVET